MPLYLLRGEKAFRYYEEKPNNVWNEMGKRTTGGFTIDDYITKLGSWIGFFNTSLIPPPKAQPTSQDTQISTSIACVVLESTAKHNIQATEESTVHQ